MKIGPIQLGKLLLPNNIFYAPLAGCSDFPFRKMGARFRPGLFFCEMVKMDALIRNDAGTFRILDYSRDMHPIGGQICGSKPEIAGISARIIEDLGFDVVDLNCGCPVDKVTKDGSGSGLLKNPKLIGELIHAMVSSVKIPVTVKIRAGWDTDAIVAPEIVRIAEEAGAKAICIHGRTRVQAYHGPARWEWIKEAKRAAKSILVIGNGDIYKAEDALRMIEETCCDGVMVARGTLGQPWIVSDILRLKEGKPPLERSLQERRAALAEHLHHIADFLPERKVILDMRRVGCWYFKKSAGTKAFREAISKAQTLDEIRDLVYHFPINETEGAEESTQDDGCDC